VCQRTAAVVRALPCRTCPLRHPSTSAKNAPSKPGINHLGREPVVSLVGDGAAMSSPRAIWTGAHEKLPVTFTIMNN
jgi:hypothetical protein